MSADKMELWRDDEKILIRTPDGQKAVDGKTVLVEIQKHLFIDLGYHPFKTIKSGGTKGDVCPYCKSTNTIGHGGRTTQTEYQVRRMCNACNRTFIAGKETPVESTKVAKKNNIGKIIFLHQAGYTSQQVVDTLGVTPGNVNTVLKRIGNIMSRKIRRAKPFDINRARGEEIGKSRIWEYDGEVTLGRKGQTRTLTIIKEDAERAVRMTPNELQEYIKKLSRWEKKIVIGYVEDKKDDLLGIFPKIKTDTKIPQDGGEISAELMGKGLESSSAEALSME